jgi:hypothetical protein
MAFSALRQQGRKEPFFCSGFSSEAARTRAIKWVSALSEANPAWTQGDRAGRVNER